MVKTSYTYSSLNVDNNWGSTVDINLKNTDLVMDYDLVVVPGTLEGGTSPAYTDTYLNPLVQSVKIEADNDTMVSADTPQLNELRHLVRNVNNMSGNHVKIQMTALDFSKKTYIKETGFPSYSFVNNILHVTLPPLSQVTSGSPTGTSGSQLLMVEHDIMRSSVDFKLFNYKMLKVSSALGLIGDNDLTNYLATDSFYQALLHFAYTSQTAPVYSTEGSNSLINKMELIINNSTHLFSDYFPSMQADNQDEYGQVPDTGFALQQFMDTDNPSDLLNLSSAVVNKNVNLKVVTTASGYLNTLKMVMF